MSRNRDTVPVVQNSAQRGTGKKRDILAAMAGTSHDTIVKVQYILAGGDPEDIARLQRGDERLSIHKVWHDLKRRTGGGGGIPKAPPGDYPVIVMDPPWPYGTEYDSEDRRAGSPYKEMKLKDIAAIEVPTDADAILFLWTTHAFMHDALHILGAGDPDPESEEIPGWGFRQVAIITWVKDRMGLGSWLRSKSEFCIMAVRGEPSVALTNQTTVVHGPLREHSRKPDEFYEMVEGLCGLTPERQGLEFFSREPRPCWVQVGNEPDKFGMGPAARSSEGEAR